jgi:FkbM family methyltransferase
MIHARPDTMDQSILAEAARDIYHTRQFLRPGGVVLDIGAYIGDFAASVKAHNPSAQLFCLEPHPDNFHMLQQNVLGLDHITIEQSALVAKPGPVILHDFGSDASACHSIYSLGRSDARRIEATGQSLTGLLQRHHLDHVDFMKLDCQGAEFEILPATPSHILHRIDYIALEVHHAIAKVGEQLGTVPQSSEKAHRLYRHLLHTHVPVWGEIHRDSVQVWARRELAPMTTKLKFRLKQLQRSVRNLKAIATGSQKGKQAA